MFRTAIINTTSGKVVNIVEMEADPATTAPEVWGEGLVGVASDAAQIGWPFTNGSFTPPEVTEPVVTAKEQIFILELSMTPRRLREAALGIDNGWMKAVNDQITALRAQIAS